MSNTVAHTVPRTSMSPDFTAMLNDTDRNKKYSDGVREMIGQFKARYGRAPTVVDLGAGSGLLSIVALHHGAAHVTALEVNADMAVMTHQQLAHACPDQARWTVINVLSTDFEQFGFDMLVCDLAGPMLNSGAMYLYMWDLLMRKVIRNFGTESDPIFYTVPQEGTMYLRPYRCQQAVGPITGLPFAAMQETFDAIHAQQPHARIGWQRDGDMRLCLSASKRHALGPATQVLHERYNQVKNGVTRTPDITIKVPRHQYDTAIFVLEWELRLSPATVLVHNLQAVSRLTEPCRIARWVAWGHHFCPLKRITYRRRDNRYSFDTKYCPADFVMQLKPQSPEDVVMGTRRKRRSGQINGKRTGTPKHPRPPYPAKIAKFANGFPTGLEEGDDHDNEGVEEDEEGHGHDYDEDRGGDGEDSSASEGYDEGVAPADMRNGVGGRVLRRGLRANGRGRGVCGSVRLRRSGAGAGHGADHGFGHDDNNHDGRGDGCGSEDIDVDDDDDGEGDGEEYGYGQGGENADEEHRNEQDGEDDDNEEGDEDDEDEDDDDDEEEDDEAEGASMGHGRYRRRRDGDGDGDGHGGAGANSNAGARARNQRPATRSRNGTARHTKGANKRGNDNGGGDGGGRRRHRAANGTSSSSGNSVINRRDGRKMSGEQGVNKRQHAAVGGAFEQQQQRERRQWPALRLDLDSSDLIDDNGGLDAVFGNSEENDALLASLLHGRRDTLSLQAPRLTVPTPSTAAATCNDSSSSNGNGDASVCSSSNSAYAGSSPNGATGSSSSSSIISESSSGRYTQGTGSAGRRAHGAAWSTRDDRGSSGRARFGSASSSSSSLSSFPSSSSSASHSAQRRGSAQIKATTKKNPRSKLAKTIARFTAMNGVACAWPPSPSAVYSPPPSVFEPPPSMDANGGATYSSPTTPQQRPVGGASPPGIPWQGADFYTPASTGHGSAANAAVGKEAVVVRPSLSHMDLAKMVVMTKAVNGQGLPGDASVQ